MSEPKIPDIVRVWAEKAGVKVPEAMRRYKQAAEIVREQYPKVEPESDQWYRIKVGIFKGMMGFKPAPVMPKPAPAMAGDPKDSEKPDPKKDGEKKGDKPNPNKGRVRVSVSVDGEKSESLSSAFVSPPTHGWHGISHHPIWRAEFPNLSERQWAFVGFMGSRGHYTREELLSRDLTAADLAEMVDHDLFVCDSQGTYRIHPKWLISEVKESKLMDGTIFRVLDLLSQTEGFVEAPQIQEALGLPRLAQAMAVLTRMATEGLLRYEKGRGYALPLDEDLDSLIVRAGPVGGGLGDRLSLLGPVEEAKKGVFDPNAVKLMAKSDPFLQFSLDRGMAPEQLYQSEIEGNPQNMRKYRAWLKKSATAKESLDEVSASASRIADFVQKEKPTVAELAREFRLSGATAEFILKKAREHMEDHQALLKEIRRAVMETLGESPVDEAKAVPPIDSPVYTQKGKLPKYNVQVTPLSAHGSDGGKMLRKRLPGWTKDDHTAAAAEHEKAAKALEKKWSDTAERAAQKTWGRAYQATDYKISGIASDEFADEFKDALRHAAQTASKHKDAAHAHRAAAKLRNMAKESIDEARLPRDVEVEQAWTAKGEPEEWIVTYKGVQQGGKRDRSGAGDLTFKSKAAAEAWAREHLGESVDESDDPKFDAWMRKVDAIVSRKTGMSVHDLPDVSYRDWFDDGVSASSAAARAVRMAKDESLLPDTLDAYERVIAEGGVSTAALSMLLGDVALDDLRVEDANGVSWEARDGRWFPDVAEAKKAQGFWRTTKSGHRIYIEGGKITKGNPHVLKASGRKRESVEENFPVKDALTYLRSQTQFKHVKWEKGAADLSHELVFQDEDTALDAYKALRAKFGAKLNARRNGEAIDFYESLDESVEEGSTSPWRHVGRQKGEVVGYESDQEHGARREVFRFKMDDVTYRNVVKQIDRRGGANQEKAQRLFDYMAKIEDEGNYRAESVEDGVGSNQRAIPLGKGVRVRLVSELLNSTRGGSTGVIVAERDGMFVVRFDTGDVEPWEAMDLVPETQPPDFQDDSLPPDWLGESLDESRKEAEDKFRYVDEASKGHRDRCRVCYFGEGAGGPKLDCTLFKFQASAEGWCRAFSRDSVEATNAQWKREVLSQKWRHDESQYRPNTRFTEAELHDAYMKWRQPTYAVTFEEWLGRHFEKIEEGYLLTCPYEVHPVDVETVINALSKPDQLQEQKLDHEVEATEVLRISTRPKDGSAGPSTSPMEEWRNYILYDDGTVVREGWKDGRSLRAIVGNVGAEGVMGFRDSLRSLVLDYAGPMGGRIADVQAVVSESVEEGGKDPRALNPKAVAALRSMGITDSKRVLFILNKLHLSTDSEDFYDAVRSGLGVSVATKLDDFYINHRPGAGESVEEGYQHVHWKGAKSLRFKLATTKTESNTSGGKTVQGRTFGGKIGLHLDSRVGFTGGRWVLTHIPTGRAIGSAFDDRSAVKVAKALEANSAIDLSFTDMQAATPETMAAIKAAATRLRESLDEVSPPGFKGTVKAMKKHPEIDNPYALAWHMKKRGARSHYRKDGMPKKEAVEEAVLPTKNEGHGFYGTLLPYGKAKADAAWKDAFVLIQKQFRLTPEQTRAVLDSSEGRYIGDRWTYGQEEAEEYLQRRQVQKRVRAVVRHFDQDPGGFYDAIEEEQLDGEEWSPRALARAKEYISKISSKGKKEYARAVLNHLRGKGERPWVAEFGLSAWQADDIRYDLRSIAIGKSVDEDQLDEVDPVTAIAALGSIAVGAGIGAAAVKAIRAIRALMQAGKTTAAEKAWDKLSQTDQRAIQAILKGGKGVAEERTYHGFTQATEYISKIRNPGKKKYARAYLDYLMGNETEKPDRAEFDISYMAAQSVRLELADFGFDESTDEVTTSATTGGFRSGGLGHKRKRWTGADYEDEDDEEVDESLTSDIVGELSSTEWVNMHEVARRLRRNPKDVLRVLGSLARDGRLKRNPTNSNEFKIADDSDEFDDVEEGEDDPEDESAFARGGPGGGPPLNGPALKRKDRPKNKGSAGSIPDVQGSEKVESVLIPKADLQRFAQVARQLGLPATTEIVSADGGYHVQLSSENAEAVLDALNLSPAM